MTDEPATIEQPQDWDIVSGVGITALAAAAGRAIETGRPDGLVRDPWAQALVEAADRPQLTPVRLPAVTASSSQFDRQWNNTAVVSGVRSRFFDDFFATACSRGVGQVVLLAAGLDTRAFRLPWPPGCHVYETDLPRVLEFKDRVLAEAGARPRAGRTVVAVDLRTDWRGALLGAGFDPARPTAWLAEGLLHYLPPDAQDRLLDGVDALSAPGSEFAGTHLRVTPEARRRAGDFSATWGFDLSRLLAEAPDSDPAARLTALGWHATAQPLSELVAPHRERLSPGTPTTDAIGPSIVYTAVRQAGRPRPSAR